MRKKTIIAALSAFMLLASSSGVFADSRSSIPNDSSEKVLIVSNQDGLQKVSTNEMLLYQVVSKYDVTYTTEVPTDGYDTLVVDWDNNSADISKLKNSIHSGDEVYFFGDDLGSEEFSSTMELDTPELSVQDKKAEGTDSPIIEEKWNLIGFKDGSPTYYSKIQSVTDDGEKMGITTDIILQEIENSKKVESVISPLDYSSDTTVASGYNLNDTLYSNSMERARINADWILKQNTRNDNDPNYDYFYLRNNVQLSCPYSSGSCAKFREIKVNHDLNHPVADNILDWGPDSVNNINGSNITVGLPWAVAWQFVPSNDSTDIKVSGGQATDKLQWIVENRNLTGIKYDLANPTRIQPGTAWSSSGTIASIYIGDWATVEWAGSTYQIGFYKNIEYDY